MAKRRQKKRRGCLPRLTVGCLLLIALVGFYRYSNESIAVEEAEFRSDRLPYGFDGFRTVLISDLHGAEFGEDNEVFFEKMQDAAPEAVFLTGDLVDQYRGIDWEYVAETAAGLAAIAPTYYVTGNHEWAAGSVRELKSVLEENGVTVLGNEFVTLSRKDAEIVLAGIDDPNGYADQKTPEQLAAEVYAAHGDPFWILLAHRNDRFQRQYSLLGADLTLSGHGHGGIIRLPFTDGLLSTTREFFPTHTDGFYEDNGATVFVSRGLGNSGISRRLFNRPELTVLTFRSDPHSVCVADG